MIKFEETKSKHEIDYYRRVVRALSVAAILLLMLTTMLLMFDMRYIWALVVKLLISMTITYGLTGVGVATYEFYKVIRGN